MKKLLSYFLFACFYLLAAQVYPQEKIKDKGIFVERKAGYFQNVILKEIQDFEKKEKPEKKIFTMDFSKVEAPKSLEEFKYYWHSTPENQGNTGTCWSFSTTSFFESEVYRLTKKKVKLSPMYTAYWEYIEKAKRFVDERGNSEFGEGSEANAVTRIWSQYGIVPEEVYNGMLPGQKVYNHSKMFQEMKDYLESVKNNNAWNEKEVVETIKSILNHYMGEPPKSFTVEGQTYTPLEYLNNYLKLNLSDYVCILSLMEKPFGEQVEYPVPDNWWHSKEYYNVPLDTFMKIIKYAIRNGFTLAIGGDVSEPGKNADLEIFVVPTFDIPSEYIDDSSREFRFSNGTTTDDHGIHLIGYKEGKDGKDWYLIKDSGSSAFDGPHKGYYFFSDDYVKLKMMDFMVHKDAVKNFIELK
ncbi:C1 family peptidase [Melioribacteraceae bacterium 4301-Me]|uniref:C1 family peptidase n=1 Tax=Pyranulibacter aquaticus TaxID=3163344 RepID=UPI003594BBC4